MKILQIRFKNLNSLVGEWEIDLTHPSYTADGIFAITGPTGSGKTTVLDAICLALYGRTPRLSKVTKSSNEIMSRQTGECFAEVVFETQSGRFRCHWSQHHAHKKETGELQSPRHEISNADTGHIYKSNISGVADEVEAKTGMDFDRFTRSMLLAQGGFSAFLQAPPDERAPILEQITGTEIYSQISVHIHERQRDENTKHKLLKAETAGILLLEPAQEKEFAERLETHQQTEMSLSTQITETSKDIQWLNLLDTLKQEIAALTDESVTLLEEVAAFEPKREQLIQATNAATLDGIYATLTATRKQQQEDEHNLKSEATTLPELEASVTITLASLQTTEQKTALAKTELNAAAPILQKARSLDQQLSEQLKAIQENNESCQKYKTKIVVDIETKSVELDKQTQAQITLEKVNDYLKANAQDEKLVSELAGVEEQLNALISKQTEISQKEAEQTKATAAVQLATISLDKAQKHVIAQQQTLNTIMQQVQENNDALNALLENRLLREYRSDKENLMREMTLLARITELEEYRPKLQDGLPCPLCGATEHPFAMGNVPTADAIELKIQALTRRIDQAEAIENTLRQQQTAETAARSELTKGETLTAIATHNKQTAEKSLAETTIALAKLNQDFIERKQSVATRLQPLGITEIPKTDVSSLLNSLRTRLASWQNQTSQKRVIEKTLTEYQSEIKRLNAIIETQQTALTDQQARLAKLESEFTITRDQRTTLYGDKSPDKESERLTQSLAMAEHAEKQARNHHQNSQQLWTTALTRVDTLQKRITQRAPELAAMNEKFHKASSTIGFTNEELFLHARLPTAQRAELAATDKSLKDRTTRLNAKQIDRNARLTTETEKKITDKSLEELEPQFKIEEETLKELRDSISSLKHALKENIAAKQRIKEKQSAIDAQQKECQRWGKLQDLIGSADGKKYRNFVQGLTFEIMIDHANLQLQKMSDRYLLDRDRDQPLELNVIDNYQAGTLRSTKNLSGGESFIVSLALALGLSHMPSKKVRVDSLFLDEGFGTLDEEALDTALNTLSGLQQTGKMIGVISHVSALKQRISTQILIEPQTGGKSHISGPGCRGPK